MFIVKVLMCGFLCSFFNEGKRWGQTHGCQLKSLYGGILLVGLVFLLGEQTLNSPGPLFSSTLIGVIFLSVFLFSFNGIFVIIGELSLHLRTKLFKFELMFDLFLNQISKNLLLKSFNL